MITLGSLIWGYQLTYKMLRYSALYADTCGSKVESTYDLGVASRAEAPSLV